MALLFDSLVADVLLAIATIIGLLIYYFSSTKYYWEKKGVPYLKPALIFGNMTDQVLMRKSIFTVFNDIYKQLAGEKFGGYFEGRKPVLMIRDAELAQQILIKDFSYFGDREFGVFDTKRDPLAGHLFNLKGQVWRNLRNKLTPTFTTGKLRGMLEQINNCCDELLKLIEKNLDKELDAKIVGSHFSIDVIASCAFGLQFKDKSPEGERFREINNKVFNPSGLMMIKMIISLYFGPIFKLLKIRLIPSDVNDYIINLVQTTMQYRKKNNIHRNDFLQLMMNLKEQEESGKVMNWKNELTEEDAYLNQMDYAKDGPNDTGVKVITDECIAANSFVFLLAGSENVSTSLSFALYELAVNPEVQKKLQQEVDEVLARHGGKLTYEALKEMTYLDLVIQERNRKYSEGGVLSRVCEAAYKIPGSEVVIEKGTKVVIPMIAIHNDPANYPDPDKFIPERFVDNNHHSSGTYFPFGDGPRICIAMRFVLLEFKACLARVMAEYNVTLDPRTKVPFEFNPTSFLLTPVGGIWIRFQKRVK